jgi:hypothetical protein
LLAPAQHVCARCRHALQRRYRLFGLGLFRVAEDAIGDDDRSDDQGFKGHAVSSLEQPGREGHHDRAE